MAIPSLSGSYIDETYQRLVQVTGSGTEFADGLGNPITFGQTPTGSLLTTASAVGNTITFTKGDGSTFPVTVSGGTGSPGGPNTSIQFNGNGVFSGSSALTFNSGSNTLTLTGSLNITGSTTQVGNNTLLGNTTLSGSIVISGSTTSPTVQIYGNTTHNGYIRFDPVSTNINQSLTASYVYVSGSTNDLYFTQNGSGYNNTTRLRWLESVLYTGILSGGTLSSTPGSTSWKLSSGSGIIITQNAALNREPYPTVQYFSWPDINNIPITYSGSAQITYVGIDPSSATALSPIQQTVPWGSTSIDQFDTQIQLGVVLHLSGSVSTGVFNSPQTAYAPTQKADDFFRSFGPLKVSGHTLQVSGSTLGLTKTGGTSYKDGANYTVNPNHPSTVVEGAINVSKIYRYYVSGSTPVINTGTGAAGYPVIDPTKYVDTTTGNLSTVPGGKYTIQRVFWVPNSPTNAFIVYYGNALYTSVLAAQAALNTEPFTEAPNTAANAIFVGYIIINGSETNLQNAVIIQGGLFRNVGGVGSGGSSGIAPSLAALTDVTLTSPTYGDLLMYDSTYWYNTKTLSGSYTLSGSLTTNDGVSVQTLTASFISASGGITGSLSGTASYALNGGVTQLLAGPNITLSPTNGLGQVTITSTGGGGSSYNTATGSYGSFYDTTIQNISVVGAVYSMSLDTTDISNGVSISGSTSPYNTYVKMANAGVYNIQFSAQIDKTTGTNSVVYIWLRKNGIDLAETNTAVTLAGGANDKATAAWNWFVNAAAGDYFQLIWAGTNNNVRLFSTGSGIIDAAPAIPSLIVTANRVDQFLSNTGSFSGSFTGQLIGTSSYATNADSASVLTLYGLTSNTNSYLLFSNTVAATGQTVGGNNNLRYNSSTDTLKVGNISTTTITGSLTINGSGNPLYVRNSTTTRSFTEMQLGFLTTSSFSIGEVWNGSDQQRKFYIATEGIAGSSSYTVLTIDNSTLRTTISHGLDLYTSLVMQPNAIITGSQAAITSITGSLQGTASWANNAITASYIQTAQTASYIVTAQTASYVLTSQTASYVLNAISASFATTASYVSTAQTASYLLNAVSSSFALTASYIQNAQTASYVLNAQTASYIVTAQTASYILNAVSSSFATTSSYVLQAVSSSFASTASYVNNLNQTLTIGSITSTPSTENTLNIYPPFAGGTGEGGQILLAASGGLYTSASMLDNYQNQFRILRGSNTGGSNAGLMYVDLQTGNTNIIGSVTASAYSGLPNDYLYVTRNTSQTIGSGNWANQDIIFNNSVVSKGISYNTSTGLASLTGGKVYRITARLAWSAAAAYLFQFSCYDSSNNQLGPTVEMVQATNSTNNISDGTLDFIYAPGSNITIKIRTTNNTTALSGEYIRGDLNTQLIIQQIA